jgi:hypothetical protein
MNRSGSAWNRIMQYSFIKVFSTDGIIDEHELSMLERLALEDGKVDNQERVVLSKIFARVHPDDLEPAVREEIARFKVEHSIP